MSESSIVPPPPPLPIKYSKLNTSLWILFGITGVVGILQTIFSIIRATINIDLDSGITQSKEDALETMENLVQAARGLNIYLGIAIFVLLIIYLFRLVKKTRQAGFPIRMPDGLAIGAWFIPLANSVLCFLYFLDVAKANSKHRQRGIIFLNLWWWLFLVGTHGNLLFDAVAEGTKYYLDTGYLGLVAVAFLVLAVASSFFAVLFFREIRKFEANLDSASIIVS